MGLADAGGLAEAVAIAEGEAVGVDPVATTAGGLAEPPAGGRAGPPIAIAAMT
ncbi:MAG: hypothetical protein QOI37_1001, partial [Chloroflexota bacterium]|nr:hypothetical protein [Chloroflexota bacterium]